MLILTNTAAYRLKGPRRRWAYNALDSAITRAVFDELYPLLKEPSRRVYDFERALQEPALMMQFRGVKVDEAAARRSIKALTKAKAKAEAILNRLAEAEWGKGLNPRSHKQMAAFFYDHLGCKPYISRKTGRPTCDFDALSRLQKRDPITRPFIRCVLFVRDVGKQLEFLTAKRSKGGRLRCTFSIGTTETFRFASQSNCFDEGLNFQNITKRRRNIFVPDPGYVMAQLDLKQAESHCVAFLSGDENYIEAHVSDEDTHVIFARLCWPDAGWTGDPSHDAKLARKPNYLRHFSRRQLAKGVQHSVTRGGTYRTLARTLQVPEADAKKIERRVELAFPKLLDWRESIRRQLQKRPVLASPLGYERQFFGVRRRGDRYIVDRSVWLEAIAHVPQSMVAFIANTGIWRIWTRLDGHSIEPVDDLQLLAQGHDAALLQVKSDRRDLIDEAAKLMVVECEINGRLMAIPVDIAVGPNWRDLK